MVAVTGGVVVLGLLGLALGLLVQTLVFRAAVALADVPDPGFFRSLLLVTLVAVVCAPPSVFIPHFLGVSGSPEGEGFGPLPALGVALALLLNWAVPALVYVPALTVPLRKGMLVAGLDLSLRALLAALLLGVALVVLAGV